MFSFSVFIQWSCAQIHSRLRVLSTLFSQSAGHGCLLTVETKQRKKQNSAGSYSPPLPLFPLSTLENALVNQFLQNIALVLAGRGAIAFHRRSGEETGNTTLADCIAPVRAPAQVWPRDRYTLCGWPVQMWCNVPFDNRRLQVQDKDLQLVVNRKSKRVLLRNQTCIQVASLRVCSLQVNNMSASSYAVCYLFLLLFCRQGMKLLIHP